VNDRKPSPKERARIFDLHKQGRTSAHIATTLKLPGFRVRAVLNSANEKQPREELSADTIRNILEHVRIGEAHESIARQFRLRGETVERVLKNRRLLPFVLSL
jgi:FAD synthase